VKFIAMRDALRIAREAGVGRDLRQADRLRQPAEEAVVAASDENVRIGRVEHLVRREHGRGRSHAPGQLAAGAVVGDRIGHPREAGLQQRGVDARAASGVLALRDGRHDAQRRPQAGAHVHERHAHASRRHAVVAVDRHDPDIGLDQRVVARQRRQSAGVAEGTDRAIDQARALRGQRFVAQAAPLGAAGLEGVDQDVVFPEQPPQHRLAARVVQIERHAGLAAVERRVGRRHGRGDARRPLARVVAVAGPLDLEDLGPEVGEDLSAIGAGDVLREIDDALSGQWFHEAVQAG
jgi:hypothetical protein